MRQSVVAAWQIPIFYRQLVVDYDVVVVVVDLLSTTDHNTNPNQRIGSRLVFLWLFRSMMIPFFSGSIRTSTEFTVSWSFIYLCFVENLVKDRYRETS